MLSGTPDPLPLWHVDELGNGSDQRYTHQTLHNNYQIALIQADNLRDFERNAGSDLRDLFYDGNTAAGYSNMFSDTSDSGPYDNNAHWWDGSPSGLRLSNFSTQSNVATFKVAATTSGTNVTTTINVHFDVGYGNSMHLRGNQPLSWSVGSAATWTTGNTWVWKTTAIPSGASFEYKALKNDRVWSVGSNYVGTGGSTMDIYPSF